MRLCIFTSRWPYALYRKVVLSNAV